MLLYVEDTCARGLLADRLLQIIAVLVIGERNFFSTQVDYQTEPIASIGRALHPASDMSSLLTSCRKGQWAPIVGTGLASFGSLYVALAAKDPKDSSTLDDQPPHGASRAPSDGSPPGSESPRRLMDDLARTQTHATLEGTRRTVAGWLTTVAEYVGTPQKKSYDDAGFRRGRAMRFPEIPGEGMRNPDLHQIVEQWTSRDPSREPSIRSGTVGAARERSNTADTLQPPSPTYTRTSRDSLNPPTPSQVKHVGTSVRERMVGGEGGGLRSDIGVDSMREQSPPAIVVTSDPSSSS